MIIYNISYTKFMKGHWSQNSEFGLRNGLKLPRGKNADFWVFANHPAVRESMAVAVGNSDR